MVNKEQIEKLKLLLKDLFQFDDRDLDFGIYRIINIKRKEISEFIDYELFDLINQRIKTIEDNNELQKSLEALRIEIENNFGCEIQEAKKKYEETPKVRGYLEKERELGIADKQNDIEEDIYDDLFNFFSRYYDKGDFISKRRYSKNNKYAIPYNGEEVYLYWANNDQYYIKTVEDFKNYSFKAGEIKVNFEIVSEDMNIGINNTQETKAKFFICKDGEYNPINKILLIKFGFRELTPEEEEVIEKITDKKRIGKDEVNKYNLQQIKEKIDIYGFSNLQKKHIKINGEKSESSELEWHLNKYSTKNTSDYFIHKDLKRFLSRELDFYIKSELLPIDDIGSKEDLIIKLDKVKVFKQISLKIIDFLSQLENFQKKLWEKNKFVISTNYCITLDYINEKYYHEILKSKEQLEEWKKLYSLDIEEEVKKLSGKIIGQGISDNDKKIEVLRQNPTLVMDTKFYNTNFKYQILGDFDDLDDKITCILIKSENFQALNLLQNKYEEKIKFCYIDPPYNTGNDGFIYKDGFAHSSWLSLLESRVGLSKNLIRDDGSIFVSIDDNEQSFLKELLKSIFSPNNFLETIIWKKRATAPNDRVIGRIHEYIHVFTKSDKYELYLLPRDEKSSARYSNTDNDPRGPWAASDLSANGKGGRLVKSSIYPIRNPKTGEDFYPPEGKCWLFNKEKMIDYINEGRVGFREKSGAPFLKRYISEVRQGLTLPTILNDFGFSSNSAAEIDNLFGTKGIFEFPKPVSMLKGLLSIGSINKDLIIDFFAGSGTTGHAVLKLNKEDNGDRKFILVEMGNHFETVLKPRILKVIYSDKWKDGKPLDNDGSIKQIIKYQTLEQYEDSLNNIDFKEPNKLALDSKDYRVKYMLEFESRGNNVFLNVDAMDNPFEYKLKIESNNEIKECNIDLVETFNYIAGINVKNIQKKQDNLINYIIVKGQRNEKDIIVIWRNKSDGFDPKSDKEFVQKEILTEDFDEILVNGNSLIPNAKSIDEVFKAYMFRGYNG